MDNAAAESFNSLIKVEYIHRHRFATRTKARLKIATWITGFYNPRRKHSAACRRRSSNGPSPKHARRATRGARPHRRVSAKPGD
uniref:Integrase core domain-containing protein n=1 Tax=Streptomyces sp. NBC_01401 TaxID=2903854 RepID=A0AAU3H6C7_9ACTN